MELMGEGDRVLKVGFVKVKIYHLSFYADKSGVVRKLASYKGRAHRSLCGDQAFYNDLMHGNFFKRFDLTFARSIGADKLRGGFEPGLLSRVKYCTTEAHNLLQSVPNVATNDVLSMLCNEDEAHLDLIFKEVNIFSGESRELWLALQKMFFDELADLVEIKEGAIERIPGILGEPTNKAVIDNRLGVVEDNAMKKEGYDEATSDTSFVSLDDAAYDEVMRTDSGMFNGSILARKALFIHVLRASRLSLARYRVGDRLRSMVTSPEEARLSHVYVQIQVGESMSTTSFATCTSVRDVDHFPNGRMLFDYRGESLLFLRVCDHRAQFQRLLRGDPLIGAANMPLSDGETCQIVELVLERSGVPHAGTIVLEVQMRPLDWKPTKSVLGSMASS